MSQTGISYGRLKSFAENFSVYGRIFTHSLFLGVGTVIIS